MASVNFISHSIKIRGTTLLKNKLIEHHLLWELHLVFHLNVYGIYALVIVVQLVLRLETPYHLVWGMTYFDFTLMGLKATRCLNRVFLGMPWSIQRWISGRERIHHSKWYEGMYLTCSQFLINLYKAFGQSMMNLRKVSFLNL